jgi:hypothetical protein
VLAQEKMEGGQTAEKPNRKITGNTKNNFENGP